MSQRGQNTATIALLCVVAIIGILGAVLVGIVHAGARVNATTLFLAVMAVVGPTIPAIMAAVFAQRADQHSKTAHENTELLKNGLLKKNIKQGYREALDDLAEDAFDPSTDPPERKRDNER